MHTSLSTKEIRSPVQEVESIGQPEKYNIPDTLLMLDKSGIADPNAFLKEQADNNKLFVQLLLHHNMMADKLFSYSDRCEKRLSDISSYLTDCIDHIETLTNVFLTQQSTVNMLSNKMDELVASIKSLAMSTTSTPGKPEIPQTSKSDYGLNIITPGPINDFVQTTLKRCEDTNVSDKDVIELYTAIMGTEEEFGDFTRSICRNHEDIIK